MLVSVVQYSDPRIKCINNDHKSSKHMLLYKIIAYISYPSDIFITGSLYALILFTYFAQTPTSLPSGTTSLHSISLRSHSVVSDSLQPHRMLPIRLLPPWKVSINLLLFYLLCF